MNRTPAHVPIVEAFRFAREGRWADARFSLLCGLAMAACDVFLAIGPLLLLLLVWWLASFLP